MNPRQREPGSLRSTLIGIATLTLLGLTFVNMFAGPQATASNAAPGGGSGVLPPAAETLCAPSFPEKNQLPPGNPKRAFLEQDYQSCVAAQQSPLPPPNSKSVPTSEPPVPANIARRAAGAGTIVENGLAPLPAMAYVIVNSWYQETGNKRTIVYAGARRDDPGASTGAAQGIVVVMVETLDHHALPQAGGEYPTPTQVGAVSIVDGNGMQLTLAAEDGTAFFFDVASGKFITPGPPSPVQRGAGKGVIVESGVTPASLGNYTFENQWSEDTPNEHITVWAGSEQSNDRQGAVVVTVTSRSQPAGALKEDAYVTPLPFGPVRVVEANGEQLVLATSSGGRFVFDLPSRQFISSPEAP